MGARGLFVGPSDNLGSDGAPATWRWNVNTIPPSAAPPHICLHPSPCLSPALPQLSPPSIAAHSSEPVPLTRIRCSSRTREDVGVFFSSSSTYSRPTLLSRCLSFSFPPVKPLFPSFCSTSTYSSPGALFIMSVHWFPILMEQRGLSIDMQTFPPSLLRCHGP